MSTSKTLMVALGLLALLALPAAAFTSQSQPQAQAQPAPPAETDSSVLQQILQSNDPAVRMQLVDKFLATFPESRYRAYALAAGAESARMRNDFDKAIEYGEKALAMDPNYTVALILVADSLSEGSQPSQPDYQERLQKAENYSKHALELLPAFFASWQRSPDVPAEQYELQEDSIAAQVHATLGYVYYRRNELPAAETELKLATDLNQLRPNSADFERLGIVQVQQKKYDLARDSFQRCVETLGPSSDVCQRRLEVLEKMIEQEKAKGTEKPKETEKPQE